MLNAEERNLRKQGQECVYSFTNTAKIEIFVLLCCYAAYFCCSPTFRDKVSITSSVVKSPRRILGKF
jgi:hypothetical protein